MSDKIDRRRFIQKGTAIVGSSLLAGTSIIQCRSEEPKKPDVDEKAKVKKPEAVKNDIGQKTVEKETPGVDVSVAHGSDYLKATKKAVEQLGGIERFVPSGSKVAILANPQRNNPGAFTGPKVLEGVIELCRSAGAKSIECISWQSVENWENTGLKEVVDRLGARLNISDRKDESLFKKVSIPNAKALKEAEIMTSLYESDLLINVPVCKDHAGNRFTGTLKNLMGLNSSPNNRTFHKADWDTNPESIQFLDQCIADLNLVVKPALNVVDATEFIITNGPFGPGKLHSAQKVVAGTDRVAIDAYCCTLLGLKAEEIFTITAAAAHGLGESDLSKVAVKEVES